MAADELIAARYIALEGVLDERQRRLYAAVEANVLGHGGVKRVHEATGVARGSILAGLKELRQGIEVLAGEPHRVRRAGAGRKKLIEQDPAGCGRRWSGLLSLLRAATRNLRCAGHAKV